MNLHTHKLKYFIAIFIFFLFPKIQAQVPSELTNFPWKTGDIIGGSELFYDWTTFFFEAATGSRYGHVGLVSVEANGIFVYEENDPHAQKTRLDVFLGRFGKDATTKKTLVTIVRPRKALSSSEIAKLLATARWAVDKKIPYNYSQMMNDQSLNCSEFVSALYKAIGRQVGLIEKMGSLNINAFAGIILKAWEIDNDVNVDLNNPALSPMSVMRSPQLYPVYANLPLTYLSDFQIYSMWKAEGFIEELSKATKVPAFLLNFVGARSSQTPWRKN